MQTPEAGTLLERALTALARNISLVLIGMSVAVLLGWALDSSLLKQIHPAWISMKANTAVCFLLLAFALFHLARGNPDGLWPARVAAALVMLVAVLTLMEYASGVDLGIDQLLVTDHGWPHSSRYPGRMAPAAALAFLAATLALLLLDLRFRPRTHPAEALAMFCMLAGLLSLAGYAFGVPQMYGAAGHTQLAIHTAIGFVLLAFGIVAARPRRGLAALLASHGFGGRIARQLVPAALLLPFGVGWLRLLGQKAGLYGTEFGVAITVIVTMILMGTVVIAVAFQIRRLDDERTRAAELLEAAIGKLEASNKALEEFARVASHDLQEPLRTIRAFGGLLKADQASVLSQDGNEYLDFIVSGAERLNALVVDLLAYSRVTTKARSPEAVDLNAVVKEVMADLRERVRESGAKVTLGELPRIEADPLHMRQLLQNLIGNALKFSRPGVPLEVEISSRPLPAAEDGTARHEVVVGDNGIGIDEKLVGKLFRPFQRLVRREDYEGTGIGLAICKAIVERQGGGIQLESKLGSGSRFIISLPAKPPPTDLGL